MSINVARNFAGIPTFSSSSHNRNFVEGLSASLDIDGCRNNVEDCLSSNGQDSSMGNLVIEENSKSLNSAEMLNSGPFDNANVKLDALGNYVEKQFKDFSDNDSLISNDAISANNDSSPSGVSMAENCAPFTATSNNGATFGMMSGATTDAFGSQSNGSVMSNSTVIGNPAFGCTVNTCTTLGSTSSVGGTTNCCTTLSATPFGRTLGSSENRVTFGILTDGNPVNGDISDMQNIIVKMKDQLPNAICLVNRLSEKDLIDSSKVGLANHDLAD